MTTPPGALWQHTIKMMTLKIPQVSKLLLALLFAIISIAAYPQEKSATALNSLQTLESFVKNTKSGRATFTQVVTSPAKDGQAPKIKTSSGTFEFLRPNRFKFLYKKPFEQAIVSDSQTLWLHDVDLNQVTARKLAEVLNGTPAAVISSAADLKGLQADFVLTALPEKSGVQWVQAVPKTKDGQLQSISIGMKATDKGTELASLQILDSFGQLSVMIFSEFEINPALTGASFQFKPPPGADVSKQ